MSDFFFFIVYKTYQNKILDFLAKNFLQIAHSLIFSERPEQIAHGHSFVLSDLSDSLTVAHFLWATWGIRSR